LGGQTSQSEDRVVENVEELRLEISPHRFTNRNNLVDREIIIEPGRSVDVRVGAEDARSCVGNVVIRADAAVGSEQFRINRIHPRAAGFEDAHCILNGPHPNKIHHLINTRTGALFSF
jgi:hypothetical protein